MKKLLFLLLLFLTIVVGTFAQNNDRQLILCTTGYGFSRDAANGIADGQWSYIQKFANLTYNGQDASVTAVRFYVDWQQYEPTLGDYHGAKLATAVQTILNTHAGMKIALHFDYKRGGPMPDGISGSDAYFGDEDIARTNTGALVQATIAYRCPSIYSQTARTRFANFVSNAMSYLTAYSSSILYVEMGASQAEEFAMPYLYNGVGGQGFYEDKAVQAWRTEYLPCRYPNQTNVTWDGSTYAISSAPTASNPDWDWNSEHRREYHRFAAWGLMRLYKEFRAAARTSVPSTKVVYFISDFGSSQGNLFFMHSATIPMAMQEFDGIYSSDGGQYDNWRKIMAIDVMKGTNPNKIAAIEFDQDDLGQPTPSNSTTPLNPNAAWEWIPRAYKHGANYVHLAMTFNDVQIEQLKPILASVKATYLNSGYSPPARQAATTQNLFPNVFTGTQISNNWNTNGGDNWSVTDNNPVSINLIDDGYWQNIWSCTAPNPCDFNVTASAAPTSVTTGGSVALTYGCSGSSCSGVTYAWSGNGISGSTSPLNITAPSTAGTYTYTVTASKSGCTNKTATAQVTTTTSGGGSNPCGFTDKQTIGTWTANNYLIQTRQYTVNGTTQWLIVSTDPASSSDRHFPRGANFVTRTDLSWNSGSAPSQSCFGGGETGYGGLVIPSGITTPSGYTVGTTEDGAVYFIQTACSTPPSAPTLSASPST
ncbi:MAG: immunoglobulin domain-containing protein, partial [Chitinophagaceae bacterium]|nr:immunoglobulin domain-containing protein [Chitinophagaceae bacterium]